MLQIQTGINDASPQPPNSSIIYFVFHYIPAQTQINKVEKKSFVELK